jgi:hypothetical protein
MLLMSLTEEDKTWINGQLTNQINGLATQLINSFATQMESFATREQLEDVETKLLTEFHKWASPLEARQRTHAAALRAMDLEMEYLSDRVKKLEDKQSDGSTPV